MRICGALRHTWLTGSVVVLLGLLYLCTTARAALTIDAGIQWLAPDRANQQVPIYVLGDIADVEVTGMQFNIQVGDGGTAIGGTDSGAVITNIDLLTGTVFDSLATQQDVVTYDRARQSSVNLKDVGTPVTLSAGVSTLIATLTFDTTGVPPGTQEDLLLSNVAGSFSTFFSDASVPPSAIEPVIINGTLHIVTPVLLGDANNDGVVSADDFAAVQANFGNTGAADGLLLGDANDDGVVSADDFASIQANFGNVAPYVVDADPIPEPATLALLALAGAAMARRRSR